MRTGRPKTHGLESHWLYTTWDLIKRRVSQPSHHKYKSYGARGIGLYPSWYDVKVFIAWVEANLGDRPKGHTLDRMNNDGNYEPGNLRWASRKQQARNTRSSRLIGEDFEYRTLAEWSERSGIGGHTIHYRLKHGWGLLDALGRPPSTTKLTQRSR